MKHHIFKLLTVFIMALGANYHCNAQVGDINNLDDYYHELSLAEDQDDSTMVYRMTLRNINRIDEAYHHVIEKDLNVFLMGFRTSEAKKLSESLGTLNDSVRLEIYKALHLEDDYACLALYNEEFDADTNIPEETRLYRRVNYFHYYTKHIVDYLLASKSPENYQERLQQVQYQHYNFYVPYIDSVTKFNQDHEGDGGFAIPVDLNHAWNVFCDFYLNDERGRKTPLSPDRGWGYTKCQCAEYREINLLFPDYTFRNHYRDFDGYVDDWEFIKEQCEGH